MESLRRFVSTNSHSSLPLSLPTAQSIILIGCGSRPFLLFYFLFRSPLSSTSPAETMRCTWFWGLLVKSSKIWTGIDKHARQQRQHFLQKDPAGTLNFLLTSTIYTEMHRRTKAPKVKSQNKIKLVFFFFFEKKRKEKFSIPELE